VDTPDKVHFDFLAILTRQKASNCLMSENTPCAVAGVAECCAPPTLDKMMRARKPLVAAEVEEP